MWLDEFINQRAVCLVLLMVLVLRMRSVWYCLLGWCVVLISRDALGRVGLGWVESLKRQMKVVERA